MSKLLRTDTCRNCGETVNQFDNGRGAVWLHANGFYRCVGDKTIALPTPKPEGTVQRDA